MKLGYQKRPRWESIEVGSSAPFERGGLVMGIIAILLSLFVPALQQARFYARQVIKQVNLGLIGKAVNHYYSDNWKYPDTIATTGSRNENWYFENPIRTRTGPEEEYPFSKCRSASGYLGSYVPDPEIFFLSGTTEKD